VALLLRSAEIHPVFVRFVDRSNSISPSPLLLFATGDLWLTGGSESAQVLGVQLRDIIITKG